MSKLEELQKQEEVLEKENAELTAENFKLNIELENKRKEYQETYEDVREEIKELQNKANKYDSLVEDIKNKIIAEKEEVKHFAKIGNEETAKMHAYAIEILELLVVLEVEKEVSKEYQQNHIDQLIKIINDEQNRVERVEELLDKNKQYCFNEDGHTGKCLGYSRFDDDEPCDYCKSCEKINTEEE